MSAIDTAIRSFRNAGPVAQRTVSAAPARWDQLARLRLPRMRNLRSVDDLGNGLARRAHGRRRPRNTVAGMRRIKRAPRPTEGQTKWLRRIALSPMMVTQQEGDERRFSLQNGQTVPRNVAEALIMRGWVRGDRDSLFDLTMSQTFRVLKP